MCEVNWLFFWICNCNLDGAELSSDGEVCLLTTVAVGDENFSCLEISIITDKLRSKLARTEPFAVEVEAFDEKRLKTDC